MMPRIDLARDHDLDRAHPLASALAWSLGADLG
jgi:hypothetical protein